MTSFSRTLAGDTKERAADSQTPHFCPEERVQVWRFPSAGGAEEWKLGDRATPP